jgi:hypothetical protein
MDIQRIFPYAESRGRRFVGCRDKALQGIVFDAVAIIL